MVAERMRQLRRGLDVISEMPASAETGLAILLPLTDELGQAAYLQRLDDAVREHSGQALAQLATVETLMVTGEAEPETWLAQPRGAPSK